MVRPFQIVLLIHLHVFHADPALVGTAPAVLGLQNLDLVALDVAAQGIGILVSALADVQGVCGNSAGLAGSCGGITGSGIVHLHILGVDPALIGAAPAVLGLQNGNLV